MSKPDAETPPQGEIVIDQTEDGTIRIEVRFVSEAIGPTYH